MKDITKQVTDLHDFLGNRALFYSAALNGALKRKEKRNAIEYAAKVEAYTEAFTHVGTLLWTLKEGKDSDD